MNALAREFRFFSLLRFAVPTIVMMLVLSFYTVVDGIFVSRFVGSNALSAVNIAMPLVNIVSGIGVMFATGGSAIVAKEMGENQEDRARGHFTLIVISSIVVGILFALVGFCLQGQSCAHWVLRNFYMRIATSIPISACYLHRPISSSACLTTSW